MFYNYVIKSVNKNWYYVGFTQNIKGRLSQHNSGEVKSTKVYRPYDLVFVQMTNSKYEARDLENFLKIRCNKENLLNLLS